LASLADKKVGFVFLSQTRRKRDCGAAAYERRPDVRLERTG